MYSYEYPESKIQLVDEMLWSPNPHSYSYQEIPNDSYCLANENFISMKENEKIHDFMALITQTSSTASDCQILTHEFSIP